MKHIAFGSQIVDERYILNLAGKEAEKSIEKSDIIEWMKTYLQQSSPKCLGLAVGVWGCTPTCKEAE